MSQLSALEAPVLRQACLARDLDQVLEAWTLVYNTYRRAGLIEPNPSRLHTNPQAIGPDTAVITSYARGELACTMTCYLDGPGGLPLDCIYQPELDELRREHSLYEVGLYADRGEGRHSGVSELLDLMRHAILFGRNQDRDHLMVVGVHPHHANFYIRMLGMRQCGEERAYPTVRNHPAVLLSLDLRSVFHSLPMPRGIRYCLDHPVSPSEYQQRFRFNADAVEGTRLGQWLAMREATCEPMLATA